MCPNVCNCSFVKKLDVVLTSLNYQSIQHEAFLPSFVLNVTFVNRVENVQITFALFDYLQGNKPYWMQALEEGKGSKRLTSGFTTVGKPKIAQKQYNSPLEMYSEEVLEEIMTSGTVG